MTDCVTIVPVYDEGDQFGFVYTVGLDTELFCREVPYSSLLEVSTMMNFLKDRNVTHAQRCVRHATNQHFFTVQHPSSINDFVRSSYCTKSTGSRFIELFPYVLRESYRQWVPDPHGVGRDARAPPEPWPRNDYPYVGTVREGVL